MIGDEMNGDGCLAALLEPDGDTTHGSDEGCDQPRTSHRSRPIRRAEQGWPHDFKRAAVTFGQFQRFASDPVTGSPGRESVTFRVGIYVHDPVTYTDATGATVETAGDQLADDIYDRVVLLLGKRLNPRQSCTDPRVLVAVRHHDGDVTPLSFNSTRCYWHRMTRFRWLVVAPDGVPAQAGCCS